MDDAIELTNVTKRYGGVTAVDRFSLRVPRGSIVGFLGPNGAGKTTTIRMIMSILYPDEGSISVLGQPRALDVKDRVGYLPEERGLYRKMTVEQMLRYIGRLKGMSRGAVRRRAPECLERVGLLAWRHKRVEALSKGMSQKLQFVATILHAPELVILDEPFSGLDPLNMDLLKNTMLDLRRDGATVIFSTHQMDHAQRLCDRVVLINRGQKLLDGAMDEIRSRFAAPVVELEGSGDLAALRSAPGVTRAEIANGHARLELAADADPNELLRRAIERVRVTRFEAQRPSLHEIFVRLVGEPTPLETAASAGGPGHAGGAA
jgi:ABC-2 type transport system ATP-binding protein